MKTGSNSSCFWTLFLLVATFALIRYTLPGIWKIAAGLFAGALYLGVFLFVLLLVVVGYFTYKNLVRNRKQQSVKSYERVTRAEQLYATVLERLNRETVLNQISAEELLSSEILMKENVPSIRNDLIRLKELASPQNQKSISVQIRDYQQRLREAKEPAAREVIEENLRLLEQQRSRIESALEEIREKEALVDLVFNSLKNVDEDLAFGRSVQRLFPSELYLRFGLQPPTQAQPLPPLVDRSHE